MSDSSPHRFPRNGFQRSNNSVLGKLALAMILLTCISASAFARQTPDDYYETSVFLVVQGIGGREIPANINEETAYLSVTDVFDFLKIRNTLSGGGDTVSGFFITEQAPFLIDKLNHRIQYQDKVYDLLKEDFIGTTTGLFLKSTIFGQVFGLDCKFNFRGLSVNMTTKLELPAIREMRQELMHKNLNRLKGQVKADTTIGHTYRLFQFGMADWSVITTQRSAGGNDALLNLSLGATLAGGEATVSLNYNKYADQRPPFSTDSTMYVIRPFDQKQQYYRWRYVNNNHPALRQVIAGKIFTQSISSIYDPVVGVQVTNTPTTYRRSFGSYTLSNFTEPGWTVELYVNNELVNYAVADASGFFTFQVPLVYGNSLVKLRFYSPWGEERTREESISVPFNFLPRREFEYTASAGVVEDSVNSRFARVNFNYGAARYLSFGGGIEYLSSVTTGSSMPFVNVSARLAPNLLLSGDYTYNVRGRGILSYRMPSNLQFELDYTRYKRGQKAINFNYLEERKLIVSKSFSGQRFALFSRITLDQIILPGTKYTTAEWLMSGALFGVGANLTTYGIFAEASNPYVYSNLSLSFRLPARLTLTPQIQYEYDKSRIISTRCEVGKYMFRHAYMNVTYEQNFKSHFTNVGLSLRYDFSFSQVSFSAWRTDNLTTLIESARGSLMHNGKTGYTDFNNRSNVGTGGIIVLPFLDLNNNGHRDAGEPKVAGLQLSLNGGRIVMNKKDTTISVTSIEPYSNYFIDMSQNNFENIAWQLKKKTMSVYIEPNQLKLVEIPVSVVGEVSGTVYQEDGSRQTGLGRITVMIYDKRSHLVAHVLSEEDGFFSFIGLASGSYIARVDTVQLQKLGMTVVPTEIPFKINNSVDGDVVDGLKFLLKTIPGK